MSKKNILVFGAGAIGTTVAAWLGEAGHAVTLFDKQAVADTINAQGLCVYWGEQKDVPFKIKVPVLHDLEDVSPPDLIIICVKNYSLDGVSKALLEKFGANVPVLGLQNGLENQEILPKYFTRVLYGVVCYNAWVDGAGIAGFQKKGPIAIGHNGGIPEQDVADIVSALNQGVESFYCKEYQDAAHSKIVINLVNSLTTLVALHENDLSKSVAFQKLLTGMTYEGMKVMKAAGYKESKLGGMPSWLLITAAGVLPSFMTRKPYLKNLKKMVVSSMAQDIILNGGTTSELETINGYVLQLARRHGVKTPINDAIYEICREEFSKKPFKSVTVDYIWERVSSSKEAKAA
ncbi:ketopantoate reductase family protein [Flexibacterium corallicola]|uniref:ketopantoate reductase family protein n=1 Tax=Flexibacterium corallicola TaxID=3037259 RepID=UPI00286F1CF2|nr:2-dehydropantoate 2-reductase [Pseudovibrio sp. M1P-2-3]